MNFDIADLLSKELITYSELETIQNELQAAIDELHDDAEGEDEADNADDDGADADASDELLKVLKVIESLIEQCEDYGGDLCSEDYIYENILNDRIDEILKSIESNMEVYANIVKAHLDISAMKGDLISDYTCASIKYDGSSHYFYVL